VSQSVERSTPKRLVDSRPLSDGLATQLAANSFQEALRARATSHLLLITRTGLSFAPFDAARAELTGPARAVPTGIGRRPGRHLAERARRLHQQAAGCPAHAVVSDTRWNADAAAASSRDRIVCRGCRPMARAWRSCAPIRETTSRTSGCTTRTARRPRGSRSMDRARVLSGPWTDQACVQRTGAAALRAGSGWHRQAAAARCEPFNPLSVSLVQWQREADVHRAATKFRLCTTGSKS